MAASSPRHKEDDPSDSGISWTNSIDVKHQTNTEEEEEEVWHTFATKGNYRGPYSLGEEAVVKTLFEGIPHISSRGLPARKYLGQVEHSRMPDQPHEKQQDSARTSPEKSIARERCTIDASGNITLMTETVYKCNKCDKTFFTRSGYRKHQKNHNEDSSYGCNSCGKTFMDWSSYNMHKVSHRRDLECDKHFRHQAHLAMQEVTHVGGRPHTCHVCDKYFGQSTNLISHMRNHAGE